MSKVQVKKLNTLTGHSDAVYVLETAGKDNLFFSAAGDGIVALWDLQNPETGQMVARVPNSVYALDFEPDKGYLAVGHNYDGVHLIDVQEKKEISSVNITDAAIFALKFIGSNVLVGTGKGELILVDPEKQVVLFRSNIAQERVRGMTIDETRNEMAVGFSDNMIRIFDLSDFSRKQEFQGHENSVFSVCYAPDGDYLLSTGRDARINLWDIKGGYKKVESIIGHMYSINHLTFSPDSKHFVTCSMDKSIKVWDYARMKLLKVIDKARYAGHGTSVNRLLWSKYKNQLISCSDDRSISVWDLKFEEET